MTQDQKRLASGQIRIQATAGVCHEGVFPQCLSLLDGNKITICLFICILYHPCRLGLTHPLC